MKYSKESLIIKKKTFIFQAKLAILKFLSVDLVEADTIIPHFIVASGDAKHT